MGRPFKFALSGLTCAACSNSIQSTLASSSLDIKIENFLSLDSITLQVNDETKSDDEIQKIICESIEGIGFGCQVMADEANPPPKRKNKRKFLLHLLMGIGGVLAGATLLALMLAGMVIPPLAMFIIGGASTALTFLLGATTYYDAIKQLVKAKSLSMDTLFTIATLAAIGVSIASFFVPALTMMFDSAILMLSFRHIGKAIEESVTHHVTADLKFSDNTEALVEVEYEDSCKFVRLENVPPGSITRIPKGRLIPIDGILLDKQASIYQTLLNGQHMPSEFSKHQAVLAGMRIAKDNEKDFIRIKTIAYAHQSNLAKLDHILKLRTNQRPPLVTIAEKILKYFVPTVLAIAIVAGIVLSFFFPPMIAIQCAIGVLASACPCTLGMIIPLAAKVGLSKAEKQHVHFKNKEALQSAAEIDTVVFDLNGTLTTGRLRVTKTKGKSIKKLMPYIASLESKSDHPFAYAIRDYAMRKKKDKSTDFTLENTEHNRSGLSGVINQPGNAMHGKKLIVGNINMMQAQGFNIPLHTTNAQHLVYVALDGEIVGCLELEDPIREGAIATIDELQNRMKKKVYICTGADRQTALRYAKLFNLPQDQVFADCRNVSEAELDNLEDLNDNSKPAHIKRLQAQGCKVAMVGDGGNDVFAMLTSNLGIAVQNSSSSDPVTLNLSDAKIKHHSLLPVVAAFEVGKQTVNNIKQNLLFSFSYNMVAVLVASGILAAAIGFVLNPWIGVAIMILQASIILLLVQHFKQKKLSHVEHASSKKDELVVSDTTTLLHEEMPSVEPELESVFDEKIESESEDSYSFGQTMWKRMDPADKPRDDGLVVARDDGLVVPRDDGLVAPRDNGLVARDGLVAFMKH